MTSAGGLRVVRFPALRRLDQPHQSERLGPLSAGRQQAGAKEDEAPLPHSNPTRDKSSRNVFVDRVAFRMAEAAGVLNDASESLADRESMSLKDLADLKWAVGRAVRSLDMVSAIVEHFEADLLTPGGVTALAVAERRADRLEASIVATVQAAIAGNRPTAVDLAASTGAA